MTHKIALAAALIVVATAALFADTLVLVDGRRIQGQLVGVFGREIEFAQQGTRRLLRIRRQDIARIEFEDLEATGGGDGSIPRGMRERLVNMSAREAWTDSGINVRPGQQLYFRATGQTRWGPNRRDGAVGERNSPFNAGRPLPDRPAAALIGRIGERDEYFFIGADAGPFRTRSNGRLYLGINDDVLIDNSGALRVTVFTRCLSGRMVLRRPGGGGERGCPGAREALRTGYQTVANG